MKKRILIVDNVPLILYALEKALRQESRVVVSAKNGAKALAEISSQEYDVCLRHIYLPDANGLAIILFLSRSDLDNVPSVRIMLRCSAGGRVSTQMVMRVSFLNVNRNQQRCLSCLVNIPAFNARSCFDYTDLGILPGDQVDLPTKERNERPWHLKQAE
ncbi:MAG: hypothetical protein AMK71_06385 [Nitrospira bacterium SG8_35_4]|nr:MAG: hypothetical protein AMK71_06385 [Nitrospira bacterium SG8_35_4]